MTARLLFVFILLIGSHLALAQVPANPVSSQKEIIIRTADRLNITKPDSATELQSAAGNVYIIQGETQFYADSVVINKTLNLMEAFGRVHIVDAGKTNVYSDYMRYVGNDRKAFLDRNVKLDDGTSILTTNALTYDVATKVGTYLNGGTVRNKGSLLTSKEATYYGESKDIYFYKTVRLTDPEYKIATDTLLYNTQTELATFRAATKIKTKTQEVVTTNGYYDLKKKTAYFGSRSTIVDGTSTLTADEIANDDASGLGEANGNVIFRDSANGLALFAGNVKTNKKTNTVLATRLPVAMLKDKGDSLFVAADTLFSTQLSNFLGDRQVRLLDGADTATFISAAEAKKDSARNRILEAYYHVRVYSDSLQAVGDSMFYTAFDSTIRLFKNPVAWAQGSQIVGDTMYLYTQNKKPKRLQVFENGLVLNEAGQGYINQVKGRTINGYFAGGEIDYLRAKGAAQSVYYPVDDSSRFIGVNTLSSDAIEMFFASRKPEKIKAVQDVQGKMWPMRSADHEGLKLRGAVWQLNRRPKSYLDLFTPPGE